MMKKFLSSVILTLLILNCYPQSKEHQFSDKVQLSYKELLDLRLQILASQMTCGSFEIIDMGKINFPVSIEINTQNKIIFKIVGSIDIQLSKDKQKEIQLEGFQFVAVAITNLINDKFSQLKFDASKGIIGYWYLKDAHSPYAKYESEKFEWIVK